MTYDDIMTLLLDTKESFLEYAEVDEEILDAFIDKVESQLER